MANSAHVCGGIYMERMLKLQAKIEECGFYQYFDLVIPQQYVDFGWGGQDTDAVALFGNQLATSKCLEKPNYIFEAAEGILYTVVCFDADRPDCAATGCYLHWVRVNVTGDTKYSSGRDLVRWQPPHPQNGLHRFFFVVFHQPTEMCFDGTQSHLQRQQERPLRLQPEEFCTG